jgi:hypothetical protein
MILSLSTVLVLIALVLGLYELFVRSNLKTPIVWAVVLLALALLAPAVISLHAG